MTGNRPARSQGHLARARFTLPTDGGTTSSVQACRSLFWPFPYTREPHSVGVSSGSRPRRPCPTLAERWQTGSPIASIHRVAAALPVRCGSNNPAWHSPRQQDQRSELSRVPCQSLISRAPLAAPFLPAIAEGSIVPLPCAPAATFLPVATPPPA